MKLLIITGPLWPRVWNNANLMSKLLPYICQRHEVQILSPAFKEDPAHLPQKMFDVPVTWVTDTKQGLMRKAVYPVLSHLAERKGYEGDLGANLTRDAALVVHRQFPFDAIVFTMQPYVAMLTAAKLTKWPSIAYLMDPFDCLLDGRQGCIPKELYQLDCVLTTPFIREALLKKGAVSMEKKIVSVSFPHLKEEPEQDVPEDIPMEPDKINLLFCGALYPEIRSPEVLFRVIENLDDRFRVHFMGRGCKELFDKRILSTAAEIRTYSPLPYQAAVNAMHRADVLINIGNNMHVHMPSKTLDYINTGKPIVNFHKFKDCPTLYYTRRYPLCMNILETEFVLPDTVNEFIHFCLENRHNQVPREIIENNYHDCKPESIASVLMEQLELL